MARKLLQHDRAIVLATLLLVAGAAWAYLLLGAGVYPAGGSMVSMAPAWTPGYATLMFIMWVGMMLAMMLPSAAPSVLLVSALMHERGGDRVLGASALFVLGYVILWLGFSLLATVAQWWLSRVGLLSTNMASNSVVSSGLLLIATGAYQWTRFKQACLHRCRSPAESLARYWRRGAAGPLLSGAWHGAHCLGCCWLLMTLLFVGGVMNLAWAALLALLVFVEKALPSGTAISRLSGVVLFVAGLIVLFTRHVLGAP